MNYRRRLIDGYLDSVMPHPVAIAIEGAKGVGKTATAAERSRTVLRLDDPAQLAALTANLDLVTQVESPVLIDEWQLYPPVWDRVRRAVDDNSGKVFLLTGSSTAPESERIHSGAGRILGLHMRPLTIAERGIEASTVSVADLLAGEQPEVSGQTEIVLPDYVDEIYRSGLPGIRDLPEPLRAKQISSYIARLISHELPEVGLLVRRPDSLRRWLMAYAAATSSNAGYTTILDAATAGEAEKPARSTVDGYRDFLTRLFILDPLPAWSPVFAPLKRLTVAAKHHLVDPALSASLLGIRRDAVLRGEGSKILPPGAGTWMGALFESLATQSVRVYAEAAEGAVGHLRTKNTEHEIDLILERPDGGVVALEVKLSATVDDHDVRHLHWLKSKIGDRLLDRIVITTGSFAYRRSDGVGVVPLALLGP